MERLPLSPEREMLTSLDVSGLGSRQQGGFQTPVPQVEVKSKSPGHADFAAASLAALIMKTTAAAIAAAVVAPNGDGSIWPTHSCTQRAPKPRSPSL